MKPEVAHKWVRWSVIAALAVILLTVGTIVGLTLRNPQAASASLYWYLPFGFALVVCIICLYGRNYALQRLKEYDEEEQNLPGCAELLDQAALFVKQKPDNVFEGASPSIASIILGQRKVPLLRDRLEETLRVLRRGGPLLTADQAESEERRFPGSERMLRTLMDILLNVGIAGTFLSIIVTLVTSRGADPNTLLTYTAPGLVSGMSAVIANVALRICHTVLLERQDDLAQKVHSCLADHFVAGLPREVTSPDERLARTVQTHLETQMQALIEPITGLERQSREMEAHIKELAVHSGAWGATANGLKLAHAGLIETQKANLREHSDQVAALFKQYRESLQEFEKQAEIHHTQSMDELKQWHIDLQTKLLEQLREQSVALIHEQQEAARLLLEQMLTRYGEAVEQRLATLEQHVAHALETLRQQMPAAMRESLQGAVDLVDDVREQAGLLAHTVSQVSQNADRQIQVYERWAERVDNWQSRLEQTLDMGHSALQRRLEERTEEGQSRGDRQEEEGRAA